MIGEDIGQVFLVHCRYKCPEHIHRGEFANFCFLTEQEAVAYCKYHSHEYEFWTWEAVRIGCFSFGGKEKKDKKIKSKTKANTKLKRRVKRKS